MLTEQGYGKMLWKDVNWSRLRARLKEQGYGNMLTDPDLEQGVNGTRLRKHVNGSRLRARC